MLTIAHADRGRPTLKDDERFRNGYFHNNIHKHDKSRISRHVRYCAFSKKISKVAQ